MENASKALIIAGAILISILLISVGIMVMNSINDPLNQSEDEAKQQAIQMFNSKFTGYSGTQKAAGVKALMTAVQSSAGADTSHTITVQKNGTDSTAGAVQSAVVSSKSYVVTIEDSSGDGYIDLINVTGF